MEMDKKKVIIAIVLVLAIISLILLNLKKDCGRDTSCFNKAAEKCARAKLFVTIETNDESFEILGSQEESCMILVTMLSANKETDPQIKNFLNGKGAICKIPKTLFQQKGTSALERLEDYCTGPLKEAVLEITVDRLYDIVTKNLDQGAANIA